MADQRRAGIPVGVERVLLAAAQDPVLEESLVANRVEAVSALGLRLSAAEEAVLEHAPEATLRELIRGLRGPDSKRRRFLQAVAATSAVAMVGCDEADVGADTGVTLMDAGGARPDVEEVGDGGVDDAEVDAEVADDAGMSWGSRPDIDGG